MWRYLLPAGLFAVMAVFLWIGLYNPPNVIPSPLIGKPAPAFSLPSLDDPARQVSTADFRGQPYLLNVWATWCVECRNEHETLLAVARTGAVPIVGLDWKDEREPALAWLQQLGNPYQAVAFDQEGRVAIDWGVYGAPETFLVSSAGKVIYKQVGAMTGEAWEKEFLPRIQADRSAAK